MEKEMTTEQPTEGQPECNCPESCMHDHENE